MIVADDCDKILSQFAVLDPDAKENCSIQGITARSKVRPIGLKINNNFSYCSTRMEIYVAGKCKTNSQYGALSNTSNSFHVLSLRDSVLAWIENVLQWMIPIHVQQSAPNYCA